MQSLTVVRALGRSLWVKAVVTAALLAAVATRIDYRNAGHRVETSSWPWLVASVGALLASLLLGALRWRLFLQAVGVNTSATATIRAHLSGMFTTNLLPSQIGGDLTRAWLVGRADRGIQTLVSVVADRTSALLCIVVAAWLAVAAEPNRTSSVTIGALAVATGVLAAALIGLAAFAHTGRNPTSESPRSSNRVPAAQLAARACLSRAVLVRALLIGLAFQGLVILALWLVAQSIHIHAAFAVLAAALPAVYIISVLPVSIGGFGVREVSYIVLLSHAGVAPTAAALLSLLFGLSFAVATLPGAITLATGTKGGNNRQVAEAVDPRSLEATPRSASRPTRWVSRQ